MKHFVLGFLLATLFLGCFVVFSSGEETSDEERAAQEFLAARTPVTAALTHIALLKEMSYADYLRRGRADQHLTPAQAKVTSLGDELRAFEAMFLAAQTETAAGYYLKKMMERMEEQRSAFSVLVEGVRKGPK